MQDRFGCIVENAIMGAAAMGTDVHGYSVIEN